MDTRTREDLLNKIRQLRGDKTWLEQLEDEYRKEIRQLRADAVHDAEELDKKSNKISKLQKAYNQINGAYWSTLRGQLKKDNEIKLLREQAAVDAETDREKAKEIKRLHQHIDDDEITIQNKQNEINNLRCDYDNRQAIITEMRNEINELKAKVDRLEKVNDSRRFHNATEALGNPEYFQEVS